MAKAIIRRRLAGEKVADLATRYHLTEAEVRSIIRAYFA